MLHDVMRRSWQKDVEPIDFYHVQAWHGQDATYVHRSKQRTWAFPFLGYPAITQITQITQFQTSVATTAWSRTQRQQGRKVAAPFNCSTRGLKLRKCRISMNFGLMFFFFSESVATSRVSQIPPVFLSDVQDVRGEVTGVVLPGAKAAKAVAFAFSKVHDIVEACASSSGWLACHNVWHPALAHFCGLAQLYGECLEKQTWSLGRCHS
jgi:hypothetical protein